MIKNDVYSPVLKNRLETHKNWCLKTRNQIMLLRGEEGRARPIQEGDNMTWGDTLCTT